MKSTTLMRKVVGCYRRMIPQGGRIILVFFAAAGLAKIEAATLTALTDGAWAEFVAARGGAELVGNIVGDTGSLASALAGLAWVYDKAKVPGKLADFKFDATASGIVSKTAVADNSLATASASSTANTKGPMGTAISATWFGQAYAYAGVGTSYKHAGSDLKNTILGNLAEMAIDPLPSPPAGPQSSLAGPGVPVDEQLEADVQLPGSDTWISVWVANFDLFWNGSFWDLSVNDPTGQFSKSDFSMSTQTVSAGPLGPIDSTVWTLNSPIDFSVPYYTTSDLTAGGTPWSAGSEYGVQLQLRISGVTAGTPEPASMALIGAGLMGISLFWRRRLKAKV